MDVLPHATRDGTCQKGSNNGDNQKDGNGVLGLEDVESFARLESLLLNKGAHAQSGDVVVRLLVELEHVVLIDVEMSFESVVVALGEGLEHWSSSSIHPSLRCPYCVRLGSYVIGC